MRAGRDLVLAVAVLLATACAPDAGVGSGEESSAISVQVEADEPTGVEDAVVEVEADPPVQAPTAPEESAAGAGEGSAAGAAEEGTADAAEESTADAGEESTADASEDPAAPPVGPQLCGTVTTTIGEAVTVEVLAGEADCAFAEGLLDTYYNDPPSIPEGSGAYLQIEDWECNSSSSQESGRVSTCRGPGGGEIIAILGEAPEGGWCTLIDDTTLDQLFPAGERIEAVCAVYIGAETSVDEQE